MSIVKRQNYKLLAVGNTNSVHFLSRLIAFSRNFNQTYIYGEFKGVSTMPFWQSKLTRIKVIGKNRCSDHRLFRYISIPSVFLLAIFFRFDVIFLHGGLLYPEVVLLVRLVTFLGGKSVLHIMGYEVLDEQLDTTVQGYMKRNKRTKALLESCDLVIAKNMLLYDAIKEKAGFAKVRIFDWGVDDKVFYPKQTDTSTSNRFTFFSPRGMDSIYQIHLIIEAFAVIVKRHKEIDFKLVLATYPGKTDYRNSNIELIKELALQDKVDVIDYLSPSELANCYRDSDATVMFPISDGLPQSMLESLFCGTPVIAPNKKPYMDWIKNPIAGQTVPGDSYDDLAKAMFELYKTLSHHDHADIVNKCRESVEKYPCLSDAGERLLVELNEKIIKN